MLQCPENWQHYWTAPSCEVCPARILWVLSHYRAKLLTGSWRESPTLPFTEHTVVCLGCAHNQ